MQSSTVARMKPGVKNNCLFTVRGDIILGCNLAYVFEVFSIDLHWENLNDGGRRQTKTS